MKAKEFWYNVSAPNLDGCMIWMRYRDKDGYGRCWFSGKWWPAQRLAWHLRCGNIPSNLCVLHKCDNPPCCNTEHLFLGTNKDNTHDMIQKGRQATGEYHGRSRLSPLDVYCIHSLRLQGTELGTIAEQYGISLSNVRLIITGRTWQSVYNTLPYDPVIEYKIVAGRNRNPAGEQASSSKLTEEEVKLIRLLVAQNVNRLEIAKQFGISRRNISNIILGRTWKHVR